MNKQMNDQGHFESQFNSRLKQTGRYPYQDVIVFVTYILIGLTFITLFWLNISQGFL